MDNHILWKCPVTALPFFSIRNKNIAPVEVIPRGRRCVQSAYLVRQADHGHETLFNRVGVLCAESGGAGAGHDTMIIEALDAATCPACNLIGKGHIDDIAGYV